MTSNSGPQPPPSITGSENVVFGDHNTQVIGVTGRGHDLPHFSITPRLPLEQREAALRLRGRDPLVQQLVALLTAAQGEPTETGVNNPEHSEHFRRVVLLHGAGGCGKTAIAEQVAYEVGRAGIDVWWVDAIDRATVEASMNAVASLIGASEQDSDLLALNADALWRALGGRTRPWLLVVDGVDDPDLLRIGGKPLASGTGWVRPQPDASGVVLMTSREGAQDRWGKWCDRWPVDGLKPDDGVLVLRDYVADRAGSKTEAKALVERLSGLPLALKLAGSYLAVTSKSRYPDSGPSTFSSYKEALDNDRLYYLPTDEQDIARIWQLSVDLLERRGVVHARPLLCLLCRFADAPIPDQLMFDLPTLSGSLIFEGLDGTSLELTMDSLSALGLIELTQAEPPLRTGVGASVGKPALTIIHPLVRYATHQFGEVPAAGYLALAAAILYKATERCGPTEDYRSWPRWHLIVPHYSYIEAYSPTGKFIQN